MKRNTGYTIRNIGNLYFIHNAHPTDFPTAGEMLTTNATGAFLWEHLDKDTSITELSNTLVDEYEIDFETAQQDTTGFLKQLKNIGALSDFKEL